MELKLSTKRIGQSTRIGTLVGMTFIALFLFSVECNAAGPWKGQVVDRETRKPIEGAVVLMVWYKHYSLMDQTREYYDSEEFVTGADGRFVIASRWTLNIFVFLDTPEIYIFKSGYGKWQFRDYEKYSKDELARQKEAKAEWQQLTGEGAAPELPRLKTRENRLEMLSHKPLLVPGIRWPTYLDAINRERINLGLETINPK